SFPRGSWETRRRNCRIRLDALLAIRGLQVSYTGLPLYSCTRAGSQPNFFRCADVPRTGNQQRLRSERGRCSLDFEGGPVGDTWRVAGFRAVAGVVVGEGGGKDFFLRRAGGL